MSLNYIRPSSIHGSNFSPHLANSVEASTAVEVIHTVEATDNVDVESDHRGAMIGPRTGWVDFFNLDKVNGFKYDE